MTTAKHRGRSSSSSKDGITRTVVTRGWAITHPWTSRGNTRKLHETQDINRPLKRINFTQESDRSPIAARAHECTPERCPTPSSDQAGRRGIAAETPNRCRQPAKARIPPHQPRRIGKPNLATLKIHVLPFERHDLVASAPGQHQQAKSRARLPQWALRWRRGCQYPRQARPHSGLRSRCSSTRARR